MAIQEMDLILFRLWQKEWDFICNSELKDILGFDMSETSLQTYLRAQGELGGFEVVLPAELKKLQNNSELSIPKSQPAIRSLPPVDNKENDSLWENATSINDFYGALQKHSIYTKSMRSLSFYFPKEIKPNASYLLIFHSPQELTAAAREVLERLFKKLGIDLNTCSISFFFKCNENVLTREKPLLKDMLCKEIKLLNPEKIIFFREAPRPEKIETPAKADGTPITFASKPAITLYSLLEMQTGVAGSKEKIIETWNLHLPNSGWFPLGIVN
jgi:hypothetical protein